MSGNSSSPLSLEGQAWNHFCEILNLDDEQRQLFEVHEVASVVRFYTFFKRQTTFDFDNDGKISMMKRDILLLAWDWLDDHIETVGDAGAFCSQFTTSFEAEVQIKKRKGLQEQRQDKKLKTQASQMSASNFTSDKKHILEGIGSMPPYVFKHMIPSQVKLHFLDLLDAMPADRSVKVQEELRRYCLEGFDLKSRSETTGERPVQGQFLDRLANPNDGVFQKRLSTERVFNDGIPSINRRTLDDLELIGGVASQSTPPDGYFHTRELDTPLETRESNFLVTGLVECKGSESSTLRGFGEVVASATNAAVALYRVGLPSDRIVIPIVSMTGTQAVFGAVYLLDPCFPTLCFLTKSLSFYEDKEETAKYFLAMLEYTLRMERYIEEIGVDGLHPRTSNPYELMELDLEKYHIKEMKDFFLNSSDSAGSIVHFLQTTEKLGNNGNSFCLPISIRLGETKGPDKRGHFIVFKRLVDFSMGFPENQQDREKLLEAIIRVVALLHSSGVVHMDLYLSNIMWKKDDDGNFLVTLIDFDSSQLKGSQFTDGVILRLKRTPELLSFLGGEPSVGYDDFYLDLYKKHLHDENLRHRPGERKEESKRRLDERCNALKRELLQKNGRRSVGS